MMLRSPNDNCHALALFDWPTNFDVKAWRDVTKAYFDRLGVSPDLATLTEQSGAKRQLTGADAQRWPAWSLQPTPKGVSLYATEPGYIQLVFGWWVTANFHFNDRVKDRSVFWGWRADLPLTLDEAVGLLIAPLAARVSLPYGFGYTLPFRRGPGLDSLGLEAGLPSGVKRSAEDRQEAARIANWGRDLRGRKRHLQGLLRDLYPVNLISAPHLAKTVQGRPLAEWVAAAPGRGTLVPLAGGLWQWRLAPEEVAQVRPTLVAEGLLIAELPFPEAWR